MAHNDPIDKKQGAIKLSEVFTNEALEIIQNAEGETALKTAQLQMRVMSDAIRRSNFILHSQGQINWTGTDIEFNSDSQANDIILKLLLTDDDAGTGRTIDLYITGSDVANSATEFLNITLANQELVYLELDRDLIKAAVSAAPGVEPARLVIENGIDGGSITAGARLIRTSLSDTNGMPSMLATETGTTKSQTMNIPLCARLDWSDGVDTFQDIWWIPHGIRWPADTRSAIGAVVVRGLETYPSVFVREFSELQQAITDLTPTGGIILVQDAFTITSNVSIPPGVTLLSRSNLQDGLLESSTILTVASGATIFLEDGAKLFDLTLQGLANFGETFDDSLVTVNGSNAEIRDCSFRLVNAGAGPSLAICVDFASTSSDNRIWNSKFRIGPDVTGRVGIRFDGTNNIDTDSIFDPTL